MRTARRPAAGFTLVELLVVIVIIGILAAILVPTVYMAVARARHTRIAIEINGLQNAVENYKLKFGDYPPDFSDQTVVDRHVKRAFPRIATDEVIPSGLDPAEALVFWLGGFSSNPRYPFTGNGGPLIVSGNNVSLNPDRNEPLFDFDERRLSLFVNANGQLMSNDEEILHGDASANDAYPVYFPSGRNEPYVFFDSRTYAVGPAYPPGNSTLEGRARPYASDGPHDWANHKTFQIISAGLDGHYGDDVIVNNVLQRKVFASGTNYTLDDLDNITNFSDGRTLEDSIP